jgi:predicted nucleic acid-binding protein
VPVVDASVVVDWVAPDADPELPALAVLERLADEEADVVAPRLLMEEVSNALLTGLRAGRWDGMDADEARALLRALPVRLADAPGDLARAWELSRRYDNHPIYAMVYVALAERLDVPLLTADDALRRRIGAMGRAVSPDQFLA